MNKLKTDYNNGDPILASMWNETNAAINALAEGSLSITMTESEWNAIVNNPTAYSAFCTKYDGYILNVTEDYAKDTSQGFVFGGTFPFTFGNGSDNNTFVFGGTFPFTFSDGSSSKFSFGGLFPITF